MAVSDDIKRRLNAGEGESPEVKASPEVAERLNAGEGDEPDSIYKDGTPWYKELAFNLALAGSNASPTRFASTPLGQQLGSGIVSGATAGNVDGGAPAPATALEKGVSALGHGAGMAAPFVAAAPVMSPLGLAGAPVGFAAYEAARPADSLGERAKNAGHGALMGAAFAGLGAVGGAVARKAPGVLKPVVRPAIDTAALTGLNVAQGMEPDDALLNAAPFVMGGSIAHAATGAPKRAGDQKLSKTPAELEAAQVAPKQPSRERAAEIEKIAAEYDAAYRAKEEATAARRAEITGKVGESIKTREAEAARAAEDAGAIAGARRGEVADAVARRRVEIADRRAAADAEARRAEAENAPGSDYYLGAGVPQEAYLMTKRATQRMGSSAKKALSRNEESWKEFVDGVYADVPGAKDANVFTRHLRGETKSIPEVVADLMDTPRAITERTKIPTPDARKPESIREMQAEAAKSELARDLDPQFVADVQAGKYRDVNPKRADLTDRTRHIQNIGGRKQGTAIEQVILRANHVAELAGLKMAEAERVRVDDIFNRHGVRRGSKEDLAVGKLLDRFGAYNNPADLMRTPEAQAILANVKSPRQVMDLVIELRGYLGEMGGNVRRLSTALGSAPMGHIEAYFPKTPDNPHPLNLKERIRRSAAAEGDRVSGEVTGRGRVTLSQRMYRSSTDPNTAKIGDLEVPRGWSAYENVQRYAASSVNAIVGDVSMHNNLKYAKYLELSEMPGAAQVVRKMTAQAYNNELHGMGKAIDQWVPPEVRAMMAVRKQLFDAAHYKFNPKFSGYRQWTSLFPVAARNPLAAVQALGDLSNPAAVEAVRKTYTATVKRSDRASIGNQASGTIEAMPPAKKVQQVARALTDGMSKGVEEFTVIYSGLVAARVGRARGYTGQKLQQFVSDQQGKSQSYYDRANRAGILNSRMFQGIFPAQSFGVEFVNMVREEAGFTGAGLENSAGRRAYNTGATIGAVIAGNMMTAALAGYGAKKGKDYFDQTVGPLPLSGFLLGAGYGESALPASDVVNFINAYRYIGKGEYGKAYRLIARNWQPVGAFTGDLVTGRYDLSGDEDNEPLGPPSPSTLSRTPAQRPRPRVVRPRPPARQPARRP